MKALLLILFIFAAAYMLGDWLKQKPAETDISYSDCDISHQVCRQNTLDGHYEIHFSAQPSPLVPFDVVVTFGDVQPDVVNVSFEMENMDMGFNHYTLKEDGQQWKASAILPVCSLGRNDWKVKLGYSLDGKHHVTEFKFQQE